jgi:chorismate mutase
METGGDRDAMLALLVHADREASVLQLACELAHHYALAEQHAVEVFEFMIATTIDIEVDYLRLRIGKGA